MSDMTRDQMTARIDEVADTQRLKLMASAARGFEYQYAMSDAQAFRAAGYAGAVPETVTAWATAMNWSAQQAADNVIASGDAMIGAMQFLRTVRLQGKSAVAAAADDDAAEATYDGIIGELKLVEPTS